MMTPQGRDRLVALKKAKRRLITQRQAHTSTSISQEPGFAGSGAISTWRNPACTRNCRSSDKKTFCCFLFAVSRGPLFSIQTEA